MKDGEVHIICRLYCDFQNEEAAEKLILDLVEPARKEKGCLYYNIFKERGKQSSFYILDGWKNQEAVDNHVKHPNVLFVMSKLRPLLLKDPELTFGNKITVD